MTVLVLEGGGLPKNSIEERYMSQQGVQQQFSSSDTNKQINALHSKNYLQVVVG
jgi:hypothetical protein